MRVTLLLVAGPFLACVAPSAGGPLDAGVVERLEDGGVPSCEGFADAVTMAAFEPEYRRVVSQFIPDEGGLSGSNKGSGRLVSARFQMGTGLLARFGLERGESALAGAGLRGIEAGLSSVDASGVVVSEVPPDAPPGSMLLPQDIASAAAFFLGDACQGLLALERAPGSWALEARVTAARPVVARALAWLETQEDVLRAGDARAPNRLLFDARAFSRCGAFVGTPRLETARRFIDLATALQRSDGVFVEGGGADTSYQGVAIAIGADLLAGEPAHCEALRFPVLRGALWLGARVDSMGRLDSSGNTRTCGGGETFLGRAKDVDLSHAVRGFAAAATGSEDEVLLDVARRFVVWATTTRTSCFP
jgi:hypothetical protein